jgi:hypothetical protein
VAIVIDKLDRFYGEKEEGRRGAQVNGKERASELERPDVSALARQCSCRGDVLMDPGI